MNDASPSPNALDSRSCYRALKARDPRFDGVFFVGVTTTGVYCRPVCPARTPAAPRCRYFRVAAQAEQAGFRACLRCRPELAPGASSVDAVPQLTPGSGQALDGLKGIAGIGPWTRDLLAMRVAHWPDAFPSGDLGVRRALGVTRASDAERLAEAWRPWRAYATVALWQRYAAEEQDDHKARGD